MSIVVLKFGGSSVATNEKLEMAAKHILYEKNQGNDVVVVVSAQGKTTDKLIAEEAEITKKPIKREHDVLVSTGEQITISKLSIMLNDMGHKAVSLTGWQIPIITNSDYTNSRIRYIDSEKVLDFLRSDNIVIVAGFQGVDENGNITTLGRGGSDTTAVALAASLHAEKCDIYTDVDGVYTADPKIVPDVKRIESISYGEMLELASLGAKVLHNRCVEIGRKYNVPIYVKSTFEEYSVGTMVASENLEDTEVSGVAKDDYISRITVIGLKNEIGITYKLFKVLSENQINVDVIVQSFGEYTVKDIAFTVKMNDLEKSLEVLNDNKDTLGFSNITHSENLSKVSIVGVGISNKPGVATKMFEALYESNINMHMISTSEIKISVLVDSDKANLALKEIHRKFFN